MTFILKLGPLTETIIVYIFNGFSCIGLDKNIQVFRGPRLGMEGNGLAAHHQVFYPNFTKTFY